MTIKRVVQPLPPEAPSVTPIMIEWNKIPASKTKTCHFWSEAAKWA